MPQSEAVTYQPSEIWTPKSESFELEEPIERARADINSQDSKQMIDQLQKKVEKSQSGVVFAVLNGERPQEYSNEEALVMFNPFANAATANMLVRAEFIREVAKYADIRATDGKLKPVVMLASPGLGGSNIKLTKEQRTEIKKGELGPFANELLRTVSEKEIGKVALLGFSQGADLALAGARKAYAANLDTHRVAVGDPAGVENRSSMAVAADFMKSGGLKEVVTATGIPAQKEALGFGYGAKDFAFGFIPSTLASADNRVLWRGLGKNNFERNVQQILDEGVVEKLVVGYGAESAIAKPEKIEPALERLTEYDLSDVISSIKVESGKHSWGDQLTLLAKLYLRTLD
jgi:pimeloyl-ACP methyl ester carboxylesterase